MTFSRSTRDYQIRCNSLNLPGSTVLVIDGMKGPNTRRQIALVQDQMGVDDKHEIFDPSGITRVHWHWTVSNYKVTDRVRKHYNGVYDYKGNQYDGGALPQQQAYYQPGSVGVSHTLGGNTGAIGLSLVAMVGATADWSSRTVLQGKCPLTWEGIDGMLEDTAEMCHLYDIKPSPWTTLTHAEVQPTLGIRQRGKWDIQVLPDNSTLLLTAVEAGNILRERMMDKFF